MVSRKRLEDKWKLSDMDLEREDECGICLDPCTKVVLPSCCHAMCINCYRDWYIRPHSFILDFQHGLMLIQNGGKKTSFLKFRVVYFLSMCCRNTRSESCPFCRGSLKRVDSGDLWVLTCNDDVIDTQTVLKEDLLRFYLYINNLPKDIPDALFLMYYEYLIWSKWWHEWCVETIGFT